MRNEKWLSRKVQEKCSGPDLRIESFESAAMFSVPDLYLVGRFCGSFWVELKVVRTYQHKIPFRKGQPHWLETHARAGGCAYILVLVQSPEWHINDIVLLHSDQAKKLQTLKLGEIPARAMLGQFHSKDGWELLASRMTAEPRPRPRSPLS